MSGQRCAPADNVALLFIDMRSVGFAPSVRLDDDDGLVINSFIWAWVLERIFPFLYNILRDQQP